MQGADLDYVGIIIGNDLMVDSNNELKAVKENYFDKGGTPLLDNFKRKNLLNLFQIYTTYC
ncbi:hypothetical protein [Lysinibacillus fusiformis]|uniref:hypothetical protein n=1 Tax=Lysinibacillus fusiformis TaxID=28031 RepID=UPI00359CB888